MGNTNSIPVISQAASAIHAIGEYFEKMFAESDSATGAGDVNDSVKECSVLTPSAKRALDNRANQLNPNHVKSGPGRPAGYRGLGTKADLDNHANQGNPNSTSYKLSRKENFP